MPSCPSDETLTALLAEGVQLQLSDHAFQPKDQPPIGSSGIVNAVLVADQTLA